MIRCLHGGPKFLAKMIPVAKLTSHFLYDEVRKIVDIINSSNGQVVAIITDNNRTNQAFFKLFQTVENKPWLTENNIFLLFDYVHLIKSIRNNWITEITRELECEFKGDKFVAKWSHLIEIYNLEKDDLVKLSSLNEASVFPKPIERQRMSTCLKIFNEKTIAALRTSSRIDEHDAEGTIKFLSIVLSLWKILSNKEIRGHERHREPLKAPIFDSEDNNLQYLREVSTMAKNMYGKQGKRRKTLTRDTSLALEHTCNGLIELSEFLLGLGHRYVLLGQFSTDDLEEKFGELRQGSGGTYFITIQNVIQKLQIQKTRLLLHLGVDVLDNDDVHACSKCDFALNDDHFRLIESLGKMEDKLSEDVKMALVYIAGYISSKDPENECNSFFYYEEYGAYVKNMNRGGLNVPDDACCQWTFLSYIMFYAIKEVTCRKSLTKIFVLISNSYGFHITNIQCRRLCNIFFKNYSLLCTPRSDKETKLKVLKLSA